MFERLKVVLFLLVSFQFPGVFKNKNKKLKPWNINTSWMGKQRNPAQRRQRSNSDLA